MQIQSFPDFVVVIDLKNEKMTMSENTTLVYRFHNTFNGFG